MKCCGIQSYKDYYGTRENLELEDEVKRIPKYATGWASCLDNFLNLFTLLTQQLMEFLLPCNQLLLR